MAFCIGIEKICESETHGYYRYNDAGREGEFSFEKSTAETTFIRAAPGEVSLQFFQAASFKIKKRWLEDGILPDFEQYSA